MATNYIIDGNEIPNLVAETRTWQTLTLTFRVGKATIDNDLAPLQNTAGKLETTPLSDGTFRTSDRSDSGGIVTITPPDNRSPPRTERDWLVADYSQRRLEQVDGGHEVTVSFVAKLNREPDGNATNETRSSNEWGFQFRSATIATPRVRYDFGEGVDTSTGTVDLSLILDANQTKVLEESASRLSAVSVREVPDGQNIHDDDSGGANTVVVTTPDGKDPIRSGSWVIADWETSHLSSRGYRVNLTLGAPNWGGYGANYGFNYGTS